MRAEIIAVGSELLDATHLDTNSLYLADELDSLGIRLTRKSVLPDDVEALGQALRESIARVPLVICGGGLGPTEDDRTRQAAAWALECGLSLDPEAAERLHAFLQGRNRPWLEINLRQTERLQNAEWLPNEIGTAPGQWCQTPSGILILLPGPPEELRRMFAAQVRPRLQALTSGRASFTRVLSLVGVSESEVETVVAPLYRALANPATTILATSDPQVELHIRGWGQSPSDAQTLADDLAQRMEQQLRAALGDAVFSRERESLAAVVGMLLRRRGQTLAVAESCTGGLIGERLTAVPGASHYFLGGAVCYANEVKRKLAGVLSSTLESEGAVSAACAIELAEGIRRNLNATWGLSVTGVAGPSGATADKPLGTVFVGLAGPDGPAATVHFQFHGDRGRVRRFSAQYALNQLRLRLNAATSG